MNSVTPVSVIIPTYNRPERLAQCLQSLAQQTCPRESYEVIVVDDESPKPLDHVCAPFEDRMQVRLLRQERAGPGAARNRGAAAAQGQLLAFTDDDCRPATDWIAAVSRWSEAHPAAAIGGSVVNGLTDNPYSSASQTLIDYLLGYYFAAQNPRRFVTSNNLAIPKAGFDAIGGFDAAYRLAASEDRDFCARWIDSGRELILAPDAIITHYHAMTARGYWRQHFDYGKGAYHYHHGSGAAKSRSKDHEPWGFYSNLLCYPFYAKAPRRVQLSALMGLSQLAHLMGYLTSAAQSARSSTSSVNAS
jgi:GT2 family glycosyltransferase